MYTLLNLFHGLLGFGDKYEYGYKWITELKLISTKIDEWQKLFIQRQSTFK